MVARLVFLTGSRAGSAHDLDESDVTFGRASDQHVSFGSEDILVSARHASISFRAGRYLLRDEGSRNGTFVNGKRVEEHLLEGNDLIQFGAGGPGARFVVGVDPTSAPTLGQQEMAEAIDVLKQTKLRRGSGSGAEPSLNPLTTTRELVVMAVRRGHRTRRLLLAVAGATVLGLGSVLIVQQVTRSRLQDTLGQLSLSLASERASRSALEETLAQVQGQADSLRAALEDEQIRLAADPRLDPDEIQELSQGVALIVFTYGYKEDSGDRFLRYVVDDQGTMLTTMAPDGSPTPSITMGGSGPPVRRQGTATGFLIDSSGFLVTNRHVALPWDDDRQLQLMASRGLDLTGQFLDIRAYFPPGTVSRPLVVEDVSDQADIALLRVLGDRVDAPTLSLAPETEAVQPGDEFVLIGYPTGVHNLMFRVNRDERGNILRTAGEDAQRMAEALSQRGLIQPLITNGSVSDATLAEVIHTASTTVGGSGGPLIDEHQRVVAVHYASVRSPAPGDPFQTQRGVPVRYVWELLPAALKNALVTRTTERPDTTR